MWKKIKAAVLFVGLCLFAFITSAHITAAPSAPVDVVNYTTKECAQISTGDECFSCAPAEGWEVLNGTCPDGYAILDTWAPTSCTFSASTYCCETTGTEGEGCATLPSYTWKILLASTLVVIMIIGAVLVVRYQKRVGNR